MKTRKWLMILLAGGMMFQLSSCINDLAYSALQSLSNSLSDTISSLTTTT